MALRDQPYIPLYVQDYLTDEKLNECSPATQGIYIKIMCVLHKSDEYGCFLLKQNDKQNENICLNFAIKFVKHLPFSEKQINDALEELVREKVLIIEGDKIYQKRMVKDNYISIIRSKAGKEGGVNNHFAKAKSKAKHKAKTQANSENENDYKYIINSKEYISNINNKEIIEKFEKFLAWLEKNAPNVLKMSEPITIEQMDKLYNDGYLDQVGFEKLKNMHNKKTLCKDYTSANLTLRNWVKREDERKK